MAKIQLKSDNINPFGGLFSILSMFNRSGLRSVIDGHLGQRGRAKAAFTHGDVFASMFSGPLCGGDCIEDVMDIKPFRDNREDIRVCSSDVILRTLRGLSEGSVHYESGQGKSYAFNVNERMNRLTSRHNRALWMGRTRVRACMYAAYKANQRSVRLCRRGQQRTFLDLERHEGSHHRQNNPKGSAD